MALNLYRPAVIIEYDRLAFTYDLFSTRITLDSNVRSSELVLDLYQPILPWDYAVSYTHLVCNWKIRILGRYSLSCGRKKSISYHTHKP